MTLNTCTREKLGEDQRALVGTKKGWVSKINIGAPCARQLV